MSTVDVAASAVLCCGGPDLALAAGARPLRPSCWSMAGPGTSCPGYASGWLTKGTSSPSRQHQWSGGSIWRPFAAATFTQPTVPDVVFVEGLTGDLYLEDAQD